MGGREKTRLKRTLHLFRRCVPVLLRGCLRKKELYKENRFKQTQRENNRDQDVWMKCYVSGLHIDPD